MTEAYTISTRTYQLSANIEIQADKLQSLFDSIEPVAYDKPEEGIIKISVRGHDKGVCKKDRFKRPKKSKPTDLKKETKSFRNQVSFYVRFIHKSYPIQMNKINVNYDEGFYSKKMLNKPKEAYSYSKGQTIFQFKKIKVHFNSSPEIGKVIRIFTSVIKRSQEGQLKYIDHLITKQDIQNKFAEFEFDSVVHAHSIHIDSGDLEVTTEIDRLMEVNMFLFTSGEIKLCGVTNDEQIKLAIDVLVSHIQKQLNETQMLSLCGTTMDNFHIKKINPIMINSDFANNYCIDRFALENLVRDNYGVIAEFDANGHPATKIKYFVNDAYNGHGRCCCPKHFGNAIYCNGAGGASGNGPGQCKSVTILVFRKGKVILTGGRTIPQVDKAFKFIKDVFAEDREFIESNLEESESNYT